MANIDEPRKRINLDALEEATRPYAPPALRTVPQSFQQQSLDRPMEQVKTFGELPTKEIDNIIKEAEAELAALRDKAQVVRDVYVKHTSDIIDGVKHLQAVVALGQEALNGLHERCVALKGANATPRRSE